MAVIVCPPCAVGKHSDCRASAFCLCVVCLVANGASSVSPAVVWGQSPAVIWGQFSGLDSDSRRHEREADDATLDVEFLASRAEMIAALEML